jgi:hypothetical protein
MSMLAMAACSSSSHGDVSCTNGVCDAQPVFVTGFLRTTLVTDDAVYAAGELGCAIYAADKPPQHVRLLTKEACDVTSFARTSSGLFWTTSPPPTDKDPMPKGVVGFFGEGASEPTVLSTVEGLGSLATLGDSVYVGAEDGILQVAPGPSTHVLSLFETPHALKAHAGALYWNDAMSGIFTWRLGDKEPTRIVTDPDLAPLFELSIITERAMAVDDSGIYWLRRTATGAELAHAPLAGGMPEKLVGITGEPRALALDEDAVYWVEADEPLLPKNSTIKRLAKGARHTATTVAILPGDSRELQSTPEGLYIAASPSITDFDVQKSRFTRFSGPLLFLPRGVLGDSP